MNGDEKNIGNRNSIAGGNDDGKRNDIANKNNSDIDRSNVDGNNINKNNIDSSNGSADDGRMKNYEIFAWMLTAVIFAVTIVAVRKMPALVPMHYNASGRVDRIGSKYENYIFPVFIIINNLFWHLFIRHYKKKATNDASDREREVAKNNARSLEYTIIGMTALFGVMQCAFLYMGIKSSPETVKMNVDLDVIVNIGLGVMIIFLGNVMPKTKRNGVIGLRTVWSMDNDETWAASNRFGGGAMMVCGLLVIIESILVGGLKSTFIALGIIVASGIICTVYSYEAYKRYGNHTKRG